MASLIRTEKFAKAFRALGHKQQDRAAKSIRQFYANTRHPSLHFEKLGGSDYCTIRVDKNFRIALRDLGNNVFEAVDIGNHNYIDRSYG